MADFHKQTSPYRSTPVKDFYLDVWVPRTIEPQDDDILVIIAPDHHLRPDQFSFEMYGTPNLFWVFWMRNKDTLIDPINDFVSGTEIYVPSKTYIQNILLS